MDNKRLLLNDYLNWYDHCTDGMSPLLDNNEFLLNDTYYRLNKKSFRLMKSCEKDVFETYFKDKK